MGLVKVVVPRFSKGEGLRRVQQKEEEEEEEQLDEDCSSSAASRGR